MRTPDELKHLASRYGWRVRPLTMSDIQKMPSAELEFHQTFAAENVEIALNEKATKKAEANRTAQDAWLWLRQQAEKGNDAWFVSDDSTLVRFREQARLLYVRHPELDPTEDNTFIVVVELAKQRLNPLLPEAWEAAYQAVSDRLVLSAEAQAELRERETIKKMSADEYAKYAGVRPYDDSRYFDPLRGQVVERGTPAHIVARWSRIVATFREIAPTYKPTESNQRVMLDYLRQCDLPVSLTGLGAAFATLSAQGKLDLQESPEDAARRAGSQVVVQHDLGGRAPGYPSGTTNMPVPRRRRKISELSSAEYLERLRDKGFRALVDSGADSFDDD